MSDIQENINHFPGWDVVSVYTRHQAIADGVLVDVSQFAKELGFRFPVAVTRTVWNSCIDWDNTVERSYQDESGRLFDVLWMVLLKARQTKGSEARLEISCIPKGKMEPKRVSLKSICGPGDQGEPVITIMMVWED